VVFPLYQALNVWTDTTAEEAEVAMAETEAKLLKQQDLYNAMALRDYSKAVRLCIELEQPKRLRLILEELLTTGPIPVATMAQKRQAVVTELVSAQHNRRLALWLARVIARGLTTTALCCTIRTSLMCATSPWHPMRRFDSPLQQEKSYLQVFWVVCRLTCSRAFSGAYCVFALALARPWERVPPHTFV